MLLLNPAELWAERQAYKRSKLDPLCLRFVTWVLLIGSVFANILEHCFVDDFWVISCSILLTESCILFAAMNYCTCELTVILHERISCRFKNYYQGYFEQYCTVIGKCAAVLKDCRKVAQVGLTGWWTTADSVRNLQRASCQRRINVEEFCFNPLKGRYVNWLHLAIQI